MTAMQPGTHQSGRFARIVRRVADVVEEMNYAQRRSAELILFTAMFEQAEHAERLAAEVIPQLG